MKNIQPAGRVQFLHGFTLVELLVVVAVIVILIAILVPSLEKAMAMARRAQCLANQKDISFGMAQYRGSYNRFNPRRVNGGSWRAYTYEGPPTDAIVLGVNTTIASGDPEAGYAAGEKEMGQWIAHSPYTGSPDGFKAGSEWIDPGHPNAYWGVSYIEFSGNNRAVFRCPEATAADGYYTDENRNGNRPSIANSFNTYSFNGSNFNGGTPNQGTPHYLGTLGQSASMDKHPSSSVTFIDGWESMLDHNGDVPFYLTNNILAPEYMPLSYAQYWRHGKSANYAWNDGHAETITPDTTDPAKLRTSKSIQQMWFVQPQ